MKPALPIFAIALVASTCWLAREKPAAAGGPPLVAVPASQDLGARAYQHVANLVAFGARHTGSPGWRRSVDYIEQALRDAGLAPRRDAWTDPVEGVAFTNVIATLPGELPDKLVIGCHHDTKNTTGHPDPAHNFDFVGANDSGSGVGLLLALARELALPQQGRRLTLELVFFDGEESLPYKWDIARALFGSRRYVAEYLRSGTAATAPIRAFVLLDMVGARDLQIDREEKSDAELVDIVRRAAEACGHGAEFFAHSLPVTDDHVPFLDAGIPAIDLIDIHDNPEWHTEADTLDGIAAASLQKVGEVVLTALPEIERFALARPRIELPPKAPR